VLRELQRDFAQHLLEGAALPAGVLPDGLTLQARLSVYRNHVALSLRQALRTTFPVLHRLVGEEFFAALAKSFVAAHPPSSPCLAEFGAALPDFLANFPPATTLPYLPDVARLEWALNEAWHSALQPSLAAAALAEIEPERMAAGALALQPSLRVLSSPFPIDAIWRANQADGDGVVDLAKGACHLLVWREGDDAVFRAVPASSAAFAARVAAGQALQAAFEDEGAGEGLSLLLSNGLVSAWRPLPA
jgi:hypothetical protein